MTPHAFPMSAQCQRDDCHALTSEEESWLYPDGYSRVRLRRQTPINHTAVIEYDAPIQTARLEQATCELIDEVLHARKRFNARVSSGEIHDAIFGWHEGRGVSEGAFCSHTLPARSIDPPLEHIHVDRAAGADAAVIDEWRRDRGYCRDSLLSVVHVDDRERRRSMVLLTASSMIARPSGVREWAERLSDAIDGTSRLPCLSGEPSADLASHRENIEYWLERWPAIEGQMLEPADIPLCMPRSLARARDVPAATLDCAIPCQGLPAGSWSEQHPVICLLCRAFAVAIGNLTAKHVVPVWVDADSVLNCPRGSAGVPMMCPTRPGDADVRQLLDEAARRAVHMWEVWRELKRHGRNGVPFSLEITRHRAPRGQARVQPIISGEPGCRLSVEIAVHELRLRLQYSATMCPPESMLALLRLVQVEVSKGLRAL